MRTYRGVVCEKENKYMVFLTEKGEFLRGIPIGEPPEVGEEATFRLVAPVRKKAKTGFVAAVLATAAALFFIMSSLTSFNDKVTAYVQLDADTAMEFGVNRKGNVVSIRYLNEAPNAANRLSAWEGHPLLTVLDKAIEESSVREKQVVITTIYPTDEVKHETREKIGNAVQEVRSKHEELNLEIAENTPEERTAANNKKMSIHQFKSTQTDQSIEKPAENQSERRNEKPAPAKQPDEKSNSIESKKPVQGQQNAKPNQGPPASTKQNGKSDEKPNGPGNQKNPRSEQSNNQMNKGKNEKPNPATNKENRANPSSKNNNNKNGQGPPNNQKGNPSKENKSNSANN